jgi:hypothetical protein
VGADKVLDSNSKVEVDACLPHGLPDAPCAASQFQSRLLQESRPTNIREAQTL